MPYKTEQLFACVSVGPHICFIYDVPPHTVTLSPTLKASFLLFAPCTDCRVTLEPALLAFSSTGIETYEKYVAEEQALSLAYAVTGTIYTCICAR